MDKSQRVGVAFFTMLLLPCLSWLAVAIFGFDMTRENAKQMLVPLIQYTFKFYAEGWLLWGVPIAVFVLAIAGNIALAILYKPVFKGAPFQKFYRGTKMGSQRELSRKTKERKKDQITIAKVPVPTKSETSHFAIGGRTGAGKSTILKEMMLCAMSRGDRQIILDSDGTFVETFYRPGDTILNPYDARTAGWKFFNEIRHDYDYERYAKSVIQISRSSDSEEWNDYGRTLFREVAKKVAATSRNPSMQEVFDWCCLKDSKELAEFCQGTHAAAIFSGHSKAVGSVRFTLSNKLPPHLKMPDGDFSLVDWVNDPNGGNLFITWNEEMKESMTPLISCWVDTLFDVIIAMEDSRDRRIWTFLDELESLGRLPTIQKAITRGRRKGLRNVIGFQSFSQLQEVYGEKMATTLLSNLGTVIALGVGRGGTDTAEQMADMLGKHEVKREKRGSTRSFGGLPSTSIHKETVTEHVVMPSQIAALDDLHGFLAFPGSLPVAPIEFDHVNYTRKNKVEAFVPNELV